MKLIRTQTTIRLTCIFVVLISVGIFHGASLARADPFKDLRFITENYAPFNFMSDGKLQGIAIELLLDMFDQAGSTKSVDDIAVLPWARGYHLAQTVKNTVLFSTTRTAERENLFKWVGPISPTRISVIAKKKSEIVVEHLENLNRYRVVAVREDIGELLLRSNGVDPNSIFTARSAQNATRMLIFGRVDAWAYEENVAFWNLQNTGARVTDYEVLHVLEESDVYFALQKDTSDDLVQALQQAFDAVKLRSTD